MPSFPQELIDCIINQVDLDDHCSLQTLSACSTVARSFLPASRARLWSRLEILANYPDSFEDDIVAIGPLVRTLALHCVGDLSPELLAHFPNVDHVEFLDDLEFLPDDVLNYIVKSWNVSVITLRRATLSDACVDLVPIFYGFSNLTEIKFINCSGIYPVLEEQRSYVTRVSAHCTSISPRLASVS
ncbi:hypothetical protein CPB85DRAFT_149661 [Mucidula mucida]|nr:hypothetical protein CPB85DRAFT_149661 [Mucidula mucida]